MPADEKQGTGKGAWKPCSSWSTSGLQSCGLAAVRLLWKTTVTVGSALCALGGELQPLPSGTGLDQRLLQQARADTAPGSEMAKMGQEQALPSLPRCSALCNETRGQESEENSF